MMHVLRIVLKPPAHHQQFCVSKSADITCRDRHPTVRFAAFCDSMDDHGTNDEQRWDPSHITTQLTCYTTVVIPNSRHWTTASRAGQHRGIGGVKCKAWGATERICAPRHQTAVANSCVQ